MNRSQFIHMITLVRPRAGIHKRKHTGYQQGRLMMGYGIRTGKDGTCFTVLSLAVTEKQGIGSRVVVSQLTGLPNEATGQHSSIVHMRTGGNNKVIANDTMPDMYRSSFIAVDTSVVQTAGSANPAIIANTHILDRTGIENHHMAADGPHRRSMLVGVIVSDRLHPADQFRTVPVKSQNISLMSR